MIGIIIAPAQWCKIYIYILYKVLRGQSKHFVS